MNLMLTIHPSWLGQPGLTAILAHIRAIEGPCPVPEPAGRQPGDDLGELAAGMEAPELPAVKPAIAAETTIRPPLKPMPPATPSNPLPAGLPKAPTTGRELFAYAKDNDLVKHFSRLGKAWALPARIVDWTPEDVSAAWQDYLTKFEAPSTPSRNNGRSAAAAR
jgi:hypothetical protein